MGRRVVAGEKALVEAARFIAEAGGGKSFDAVRSFASPRARIERFVALSGGIEKGGRDAAHRDRSPGEALAEKMVEARRWRRSLPREKLNQAMVAFATGGVCATRRQAELIATVLAEGDPASSFAALCGVVFTKKMEPKARSSVFSKGTAADHPNRHRPVRCRRARR